MELIPTVDPYSSWLKPTRFARYSDRALLDALNDLAREFARRQPDFLKMDVLFFFNRDYEFESYIYWHACKQGCSDPDEVPF